MDQRKHPHGTQPAAHVAHRRLDEALKAQPQWVQTELEALKKHESTILRALEDEANKELFVRDPAALLGKLKVPVSGALKARMRADASLASVRQPVCFRLPTGQTITPRVNIRFTKEGR